VRVVAGEDVLGGGVGSAGVFGAVVRLVWFVDE